MKISSNNIGCYFFSQKKEITKTHNINKETSLNKTSFKGEVYQSQEIQNQIGSEEVFFQKFLKRKGKVSKEEYDDIVKNHPRTLAKSYEMCSKDNVDINSNIKSIATVACNLKDFYDNLYDNNYTVVSVGRSPAPFTEVMQNLGCNVIFLPISSLGTLSDSIKKGKSLNEIEAEFPNIKIMMDYATKKGIAKKDVGEIVILDHTASGKSLKVMEALLKKRGDIPQEKIHSHELMTDISTAKKFPLDIRDFGDVYFDLAMHDLKKVCNVPRFSSYGSVEQLQTKNTEYNDLANLLHTKMDNFSKPLARAWCLCATNEAMKLSQ